MNKFLRHVMRGYLDEANDGTGGSSGGAPAGDSGNQGAGTGADNQNGQGGDGGQGGKDDKGAGEGKEGKISDNEAKLLREVMDKKGKLDKLSSELNQAKDQLKKFEGIDPEAVRALLKEKEDAENNKLEAKGEWDRLKARMAEEHTKQIQGLQGEVDQAKQALNAALNQIQELSVGNLFGQSAFIRDKLTLPPTKARALYAQHFEYIDSKVVGYDKPKGAENRTAFVDSMGNALSFDDVMAKLVETDPEKDYLLRASIKTGAGSESGKPNGNKQPAPENKDGVSKIADGLKALNINP